MLRSEFILKLEEQIKKEQQDVLGLKLEEEELNKQKQQNDAENAQFAQLILDASLQDKSGAYLLDNRQLKERIMRISCNPRATEAGKRRQQEKNKQG